MPEGPEVEVIRRNLDSEVKDEKILDFDLSRAGENILRHMKFKDVIGSTALKKFLNNGNYEIDRVARRGKLLIFCLRNSGSQVLGSSHVDFFECTMAHWYLTCNLGMSGKFFLDEVSNDLKKHIHFILKFENYIMKYVDVRRFGLWRLFNTEQMNEHLKTLGVDGLNSTSEVISEKLNLVCRKMKKKTKKRSIKDILLDQSYVAGIGNIYASELCYDLKVDPCLPFDSLNERQISQLSENIVRMLNAAADNGGSSIRDYASLDGQKGEQQNFLKVYGRSKRSCYKCSSLIQCFEQEGRRTFVCPECQNVRGQNVRKETL